MYVEGADVKGGYSFGFQGIGACLGLGFTGFKVCVDY